MCEQSKHLLKHAHIQSKTTAPSERGAHARLGGGRQNNPQTHTHTPKSELELRLRPVRPQFRLQSLAEHTYTQIRNAENRVLCRCCCAARRGRRSGMFRFVSPFPRPVHNDPMDHDVRHPHKRAHTHFHLQLVNAAPAPNPAALGFIRDFVDYFEI